MPSLESALAEQHGFDARDIYKMGFLDGIAGFLEQGNPVSRDVVFDVEAVRPRPEPDRRDWESRA